MPVAIDEGHGATLVLGTSTWHTAALLKSISFDAVTRASLETTNLATVDARTYMPEDLPDYGSLTVEFYHIDSIAPPYRAAETITIAYPTGTGQATPAKIACSGFLVDYTPGAAAVGDMMMGTAKWKLTGVMTFTAALA